MSEHHASDGRPCEPRTKAEIAAVFDSAAATYDHTGECFFSVFGERLAELAGIRPGQSVLDVASGRGASALPAARLAGPDGRVVALDLAGRMVDELAREARARRLPNLEVRVMDAEELDAPDDSYDRVLGGFCLFFFPHPGRALSQMRRVLRPGGRLALSTWLAAGEDWRWLDDLVEAYLRRAGAPGRPQGRPTAGTGTAAGMTAALSQAGFDRIELVVETAELTSADEDEWWASLWTRGKRGSLQRIARGLGPAGLAEFEAEARRQVRRVSPPGAGPIRRPVPVLYSLARKPGRPLI